MTRRHTFEDLEHVGTIGRLRIPQTRQPKGSAVYRRVVELGKVHLAAHETWRDYRIARDSIDDDRRLSDTGKRTALARKARELAEMMTKNAALVGIVVGARKEVAALQSLTLTPPAMPATATPYEVASTVAREVEVRNYLLSLEPMMAIGKISDLAEHGSDLEMRAALSIPETLWEGDYEPIAEALEKAREVWAKRKNPVSYAEMTELRDALAAADNASRSTLRAILDDAPQGGAATDNEPPRDPLAELAETGIRPAAM